MNEDKPFLSSGILVESYALLTRYMDLCKQRGLDCSPILPSSDTLSQVLNAIEKGSVNLQYLIEHFNSILTEKIDCDVVMDAFKQVYNVEIDCSSAKKLLLFQLVGWYLEILASLGYVKLKHTWRT
ncbi:MAG: hypothetical protein QXE81_05900 [Desulfurococcaceae archaeon]